MSAASVLALLLAGRLTVAQTEARPADGALLERRPCAATPSRTFEQYRQEVRNSSEEEGVAAKREGLPFDLESHFAARLMPPEEFVARESFSAYECSRIVYGSDGLRVVGFLWKPRGPEGRKWPLVIANRGGNREFGKLSPQSFFYPFVSKGFVVLASQYRGVDGGEGHEEFGGADVDDVMNLVPLARSLGYVDMDNVFLYGVSRGGMMTALAVKRGIAVNAAAIVSGMMDMSASARERPEMVERVWKELIPDFATRGADAMRERSAVSWPEAIRTPLLILHGTADWRVSPSQALDLARGMQAAGRTYELVVYAGDDHGVGANRADRDRRVIAWFRKHAKGPPS